jgi:hypothetical protein
MRQYQRELEADERALDDDDDDDDDDDEDHVPCNTLILQILVFIKIG